MQPIKERVTYFTNGSFSLYIMCSHSYIACILVLHSDGGLSSVRKSVGKYYYAIKYKIYFIGVNFFPFLHDINLFECTDI